MTTANLIMYLIQNPEFKKKLLEETMPVVKAAKNNILEDLTYDSVADFEYL